jgi:hypothetical protein
VSSVIQPPYPLDLTGRDDYYHCSELGSFHGVGYDDLSALYAEKIDHVLRPVTKAMMHGKFLEDGIRLIACMETGINFNPSFNKTLTHPEYPKYSLRGTPDALADDPNDGGLEIKKLNWFQRNQFDELTGEMPPQWELQARGCMSLTRRPRWHVAVWSGDRLYTIMIERDLEFEEFILDGAERLWRRYFVERVPPPVGGSKITAEWLQKKWPSHKRPDIRPATDEEIELLTAYGKVRAQQDVLKKERALMENQLKEAIKDREGLSWPGGRFTWRRAKDSTWVDWESMAVGLRTHFIKDEDARKKITDDHTHTKPGSRRINFKSDQFAESEEAADAA